MRENKYGKLTRFQANYILFLSKGGKFGKRHSFRALARKFTSRYRDYCEETGWIPDGDEYNIKTENMRDIYPLVPNSSSENQLLGMELCRDASKILEINIDED